MFPDLMRKFLGANLSFNVLGHEWKLKAIFACKPEAKWTSGVNESLVETMSSVRKGGIFKYLMERRTIMEPSPFSSITLWRNVPEEIWWSSQKTCTAIYSPMRLQSWSHHKFTQKVQIQVSVSLHIPWNPCMIAQDAMLIITIFIELICRLLVLWSDPKNVMFIRVIPLYSKYR